MNIKMTELQKAYLMSKKDDFQGGTGTHLYIELLYNGQIRDLEEAFNKVIASQPMLKARVFDNENFLIEETLNYKIKIIDSQFDEQSLIELKRKELSHKKYEVYDYPFFTMEAIGKNGNFRVIFSIDLLFAQSGNLFVALGRYAQCYLCSNLLMFYSVYNPLFLDKNPAYAIIHLNNHKLT